MSTLVYPQLMQFPAVKRRQMRTVANGAADGSSIRLADPAGAITEWRLEYAELSDAELAGLEAFFAAAEGTLNGFTFLDPQSNLLAYGGTLDNPVWAAAPGLKVSAQSGYYTVENTGAGAQSLTQTLGGAPIGYLYCLSARVRAAVGAPVTMLIGSNRAERTVTAQWDRIVFATAADAATFGLELPASASVDVSGIQVEAQLGASAYRGSTVGGVYEGARLGNEALEIVTLGPNRHSCRVSVIYANHL